METPTSSRRAASRRCAPTSTPPAAANAADRKLIKKFATKAVACAFAGKSGVVGEDEERGNKLRAIEFERIKGGKPFNTQTEWFVQLLKEIGQPMGAIVQAQH